MRSGVSILQREDKTMHINYLSGAFRGTISALILALIININVSNPAKAQNTTLNNNQQAVIINKNQKILALLRTNLDTKTTKKGDPVSAVLMDDVIAGQKILIPKNSVLTGQVYKVFKPKRLNMDAAIVFGINQIQTPQGQIINVTGKGTKFKIQSPYAKTIKNRIALRAPVSIASSGTSIPLDAATNLNGGVIYAISTGASIVSGFATGIFTPQLGQTRMDAAFSRAFSSSPIGGLKEISSNGKDINLKCGDGIMINFSKDLLSNLYNTVYPSKGASAPQPAISQTPAKSP